eukprot:CAMPEP_0176420900 /NCGR_PEP_ID=MMETSP0127-20121128/8865_1 /TAXON_ID=938130 /ORGANISM="Platyophrya macrostoma, Strain WH" /LENGTH=220 /DNA_ID=CAMNT_0017801551 /DNA_START=27 /DNA_END=689 /DNA_ORIENTATION=+
MSSSLSLHRDPSQVRSLLSLGTSGFRTPVSSNASSVGSGSTHSSPATTPRCMSTQKQQPQGQPQLQRQAPPQCQQSPASAQQRELKAWRQSKLHHFILSETRKITNVSRNDHRVMLRILISEAQRLDPNRQQNRKKWEDMLHAVERECRSASTILTVAPDPYNGSLAKLSSMMLWNDEAVRKWHYRYNDDELARRKTVQTKTLAELKRQGGLFLVDERTH